MIAGRRGRARLDRARPITCPTRSSSRPSTLAAGISARSVRPQRPLQPNCSPGNLLSTIPLAKTRSTAAGVRTATRMRPGSPRSEAGTAHGHGHTAGGRCALRKPRFTFLPISRHLISRQTETHRPAPFMEVPTCPFNSQPANAD